jgi:predicted  nucleic acid-binding Zn-ribbon protein
MGLNADQIVAWIAARKLSPEARQKLETLAAKKRDLSDATAAIQQLEARINALSADESRLRQNIQSLNSVVSQRPQVEKWAADLAAKEVFIIDHQSRLDEARKKKAALESELAQLVEKLSF